MNTYRVSLPTSCHYGDVGTLLDKAEAKRRTNCRDGDWYAYWDVLLDFSCGESPHDLGTGFRWSEIERIDQ